MNKVEKLIADHEGYRRFVYKCSAGFMTVGIGRNLEAKGVSEQEALFLLQNDIAECVADLQAFSFWERLSEVRQAALIDMRFNLGASGLRRFQKMIVALGHNDYTEAARQALDSQWARQVGPRALRVARMIETGEW